ncbi:uncharacterized protein B0T23DRAFT_404933 [Neurospora hispaniola]|uniref:Uncharacterized protein n=1 Tax=Neurospora hispaniola TaxID=588809 RepID=A0AAJ0I8J8_9PEZI|nr:hypothetical protein B0T23DRAFT_404933 [Neurospora hispaniola]
MSNAMSQRASEEPEDQVQGASNTAGTAVDATTMNGTSGNTDISEEDSDAWYRNHNVPPNSFASSSSRSSSSSTTSSVATTPGFTNSDSISNNSAGTRETSPPPRASSGDGSPVINHHHQQPQHHPQQHNHHPHPNPIPIPNLNHPQSNQHPPPAQDPLFRRLCTTWLRHLHHVLQAHALVVRAQHIHDTRWLQVNSHLLWTVAPLTEEARLWWVAWHTQNERRMLREAEWRLWVLMNEDTPRLVRVFGQGNLGWKYHVLFTKSNLLSLITFAITIANRITIVNQHNMRFVMAQPQPSTTIPIPPALPSMDQSDIDVLFHHPIPTEPRSNPNEADGNLNIASEEPHQTAESPNTHPDSSEDIPRPATPSTSTPVCYDTYSALLIVAWLATLPDYLPPRRRRQRCRVHCRRHQHARHCFGGVNHTAEEGMDLDDFTEKDWDMVE